MPPGWRDATAERSDGPITFILEGETDSAALQFSFTSPTDVAPYLTDEALRGLATNLSASSPGTEVLSTDSGFCKFGRYASARYRLGSGMETQLWVISDERNIIFATLTASGQVAQHVLAQVVDSVLGATLAEGKPWYRFW